MKEHLEEFPRLAPGDTRELPEDVRRHVQRLVDANGETIRAEALDLFARVSEAYASKDATGISIVLASDRLVYDFHGPMKQMNPYTMAAILRRAADAIDAAGGVTTLPTHYVHATNAMRWAPEVPRHVTESTRQDKQLRGDTDQSPDNAGVDQRLDPPEDDIQ